MIDLGHTTLICSISIVSAHHSIATNSRHIMAHGTDERSPLLENGFSHEEDPEVGNPMCLPPSH